jgi:hypothetical protein
MLRPSYTHECSFDNLPDNPQSKHGLACCVLLRPVARVSQHCAKLGEGSREAGALSDVRCHQVVPVGDAS